MRFISGSKRSRISESTTATILSTSDAGNEDDRDSDSGGELRTDRSLGKITLLYIPIIDTNSFFHPDSYANKLSSVLFVKFSSRNNKYYSGIDIVGNTRI